MGKSTWGFCCNLFLLLSFTGLAQAQTLGLYDSLDESNFSYTKLKSLIETKNLKTVEEVLKESKALYPEFFQNYILMYHSRSLQGASFKNPRALLFDKSGHFVFTFNGHSEQRGYDKLELMQFKTDTRSFEFREISFNENSDPVFSKANPDKCLVCHQQTDRKNIDTRPNWEPYSTWPGAYGSISGRIGIGYYHRNLPSLKNADPLILENAEKESEEIERFFAEVHGNHTRYSFLDKEAFEPRQTVAFTELQNILGFQRIARIITEDLNPLYESIKYTIAAGALCGRLSVSKEAFLWLKNNWGEEEFISKDSTTPYANRSLEDEKGLYYHQTYVDKGSGQTSIRRVDIDFKDVFLRVNTSEFLHHVFEPLGISTKDWSQDFKTGGKLAFRERFGSPSNVQFNFKKAFREQFKSDGLYEEECKDLNKKSAAQFDEFMKSELFMKLQSIKESQSENDETPIISRCVSCHESKGSGVPYIPFSKPEELKTRLMMPASLSSRLLIDEIKYRLGDFVTEEDRMPLGPIVSDKQRYDLISYLEFLLE